MSPTTEQLKNKLATQNANGAASTAVATTDTSPAAMVRRVIEKQTAAFKTILPSHVDHARFARLVLTAIKANPQLLQCFGTPEGEMTVLLSAMKAAAIGLEPNTPLQECWLQPRRNSGKVECELSIGYRGYMKLGRRSGNIKTIVAEVVHERDEFRWERGLEADVLEHRPYDGDDDDAGPLTHAYAIVRFTNGGYAFVVLNRAQVHKRRAMSESWKSEKGRPFSPWTKWPEEMWKKTAIRALVPFMDLSTEIAHDLAADERPLALDDEAGVIDVGGEWDDEQPTGELPPSPTPEAAGNAPQPAPAADAGDGHDNPPVVAAPAEATDAEPIGADAARKLHITVTRPNPETKKTIDRDLHEFLALEFTNGRTGEFAELTEAQARQVEWRAGTLKAVDGEAIEAYVARVTAVMAAREGATA